MGKQKRPRAADKGRKTTTPPAKRAKLEPEPETSVPKSEPETPQSEPEIPQSQPSYPTIRCPAPDCGWEGNSRSTRQNLPRHIKNFHPDFPPFECDRDGCARRFHTKEDKKAHVDSSHPKKTWACPVSGCNKVCEKQSMWKSHTITKHSEVTFSYCGIPGCYAIFMSEDDLGDHVLQQHPDRAIHCRVDGCPKVFGCAGTEKIHNESKHCKLELPCLVASCSETFSAYTLRNLHLRDKHPGEKVYTCKHHDCEEVFARQDKMREHFDKTHLEAKDPIPCPKDGCGEAFPDLSALKKHKRDEHSEDMLVCPKEDCKILFNSAGSLRKHILNKHKYVEGFPCTHEGCPSVLDSKGGLNAHVQKYHESDWLKCPVPGCTAEPVADKYKLSGHIQSVHPGWSDTVYDFPCPLAEKEMCHDMFETDRRATMHANVAHEGKFPCPYESIVGCETLFKDSNAAIEHKRNVHERYFCKVPNCVDTVMGYALTWSGYWQHHRQIHTRAAGVSQDSIPEPKKVIIPAPDAVNDESDDTMENDAVEDDSIDEDPTEDDSVEMGSRAFPLARATYNVDSIEDGKASLRQRNDKLVRDSTRSFRRSLGLKCAGPSKPVDKIVTAFCPSSTILSYDTAPVLVSSPARKETRLSARCFECNAHFVFQHALQKYGLLASESPTVCAEQGCFKVPFQNSRLCQAHLSSWTIPVEVQSLKDLKASLAPALDIAWTAADRMRNMLRLFHSIQAGKSHESELRFLDLEFNCSTRRVFEIGMCNAEGEITLDYQTKYRADTHAKIVATRNHQNAYMDSVIGNSIKKHNCKNSRMTAHQVARKLREQGITPRTLFVTWHKSSLDLTALREWLESEGEYRVLPDDSQCLPVIVYFRRNLRTTKTEDGRLFPLNLEIVFPLFMGLRHELAGRNHHAAVDAQQLRIMVEIFAMLCRAPKDRPKDWMNHLQQGPGQSGLQQTSLETFWKMAKGGDQL